MNLIFAVKNKILSSSSICYRIKLDIERCLVFYYYHNYCKRLFARRGRS